MKKISVKLLDGTTITGKTLRHIIRKVGNAPFIPSNAEYVDVEKLLKRWKGNLDFFKCKKWRRI